jgi:hypothetical protein
MFITEERSNYDLVLAELLRIADETGALGNAVSLGGTFDGETAMVPIFGTPCLVRPDGVYQNGQRLDTIGAILAARYLLQAGKEGIENEWLPYRDLKDGAQFSSYIKAHIEDPTAAVFTGKSKLLQSRLEGLQGNPYTGEVHSDLAFVVYPLPRVPVLCLFWDRDEEFPASFQFLFDASACSYLDLEALAAALQYIYMKITEEV